MKRVLGVLGITIIVMLVSACRDRVERHYPCRDLMPRKAELDAYSIKSRGRIHECEGVILESMSFRVGADLSKSVNVIGKSRVVLLMGGDQDIHSYIGPASEYIKRQEDRNTWKDHEKLVPLSVVI